MSLNIMCIFFLFSTLHDSYAHVHRNRHPSLDKSNKILIVITVFRLISHQMEFRLTTNKSGKFNYNKNLIKLKKKSKIMFLSVQGATI